MKGQIIRRIIACFTVACLLTIAQGVRADVVGSISGTITDRSGAVLPAATVALKNPDTGYDRQTTVNSAGFYEFPSVPVGDHYQLEVHAAGFKPLTQLDIKLLVNQSYRADFQLEVGEVSQTVKCRRAARPGGNGEQPDRRRDRRLQNDRTAPQWQKLH